MVLNLGIVLNLGVGAVTLGIGLFATFCPRHAARLWAWRRLHSLAPRDRDVLVAGYRVLGILLSLAGVFVAIEGFRRP